MLEQSVGTDHYGRTDRDGRDRVQLGSAGQRHQDRAEQHRRGDRRIAQQVQHRRPAIEIQVGVRAKESSREQVDRNARGGRHRHGAGHQGFRLLQAVQPLHHHQKPRTKNQQAIDQGRQVGAASIAIGEATAGGTQAQPLGAPGQQQTHHIPQVVDRIADQGQRAKAKANRQLRPGQKGIEQNAPAKRCSCAAVMVMVMEVMRSHRSAATTPLLE